MVSRKRRHTIIGNSAAGLSAVRAIRRTGDDAPIVLISAEKHRAYSPVLTTYYIGGQINRDDLFLVDHDFYKQHGVKTIFSRRAVAVDPLKQRVVLDDGSGVDYDTLLIATGASARRLDEVEPDAAGRVFTLRTIDDADRIKKAARGAREVVVTGAGLVSLQTIKAIAGQGLKITTVVGSRQVLSQQVDADGAAIIQRKMEAAGVSFLFGRGIKGVRRRGEKVEVVTDQAEALPADVVIVGKGVESNIGLVKDSGINTSSGVLVDRRMRTNQENVFAAGDVAEGENQLSGRMEVIATWFNACAQGEVAGLNMAGRTTERRGQFRENVTTLMGVVAASVGLSRPRRGEFEEISHLDRGQAVYRKLFLDEGRLVGALLLNRVGDAGVIRHCIANRVDVSPWAERIARAPLDFGRILCGRHGAWPHLGG